MSSQRLSKRESGMSMSSTRRLKLTAAAGLLACALGCGTVAQSGYARDPLGEQPGHVRQMLIAELRRQVAAWPRAESLHERQVSWLSGRSLVIEDLRYYVADYRSNGATHGVAQAVVGVRGDKSVLLGTQQAWRGLTEQWSPSNEEQVVAACREFIRAAGRSRIRANVPQVLTRESFEREGLHPDQFAEFNTREGVDRPEVTRTGSVWYSAMWVPEVRLGYTLFAMRYECTFPIGGSSERLPTLSVVDSIPGLTAPVE